MILFRVAPNPRGGTTGRCQDVSDSGWQDASRERQRLGMVYEPDGGGGIQSRTLYREWKAFTAILDIQKTRSVGSAT